LIGPGLIGKVRKRQTEAETEEETKIIKIKSPGCPGLFAWGTWVILQYR
jgi:hypothetical protein